MTVAIQALSGYSATTNGTSLTNNGLTVGAGATSLLAAIAFLSPTILATGISITWGGTALSLVSTITTGDTTVQFYGLISPATGNLLLSASWSNSVEAVLSAISFTGTASDILANVFINATSNTGTGTSASLSLPTVGGYISVAQLASYASSTTSLTSTSSSTIYNTGAVVLAETSSGPVSWTGNLTSLSPFSSDFSSAFGAAASNNPWVLLGIDVAPPFVPFQNFGLQPLIAQ